MRPYSLSKASPISSWMALGSSGMSVTVVPATCLKLMALSWMREMPQLGQVLGNVVL